MAIPESDFLPGISGRDPAVQPASFDARAVVRKARRRALFTDMLDLALLLGVDLIFGRWSAARLPFLSRSASLEVVVAFNLLVIASCLLSRKFPEWRARRISATWSSTEQQKTAAPKSHPKR